MNCNAARGAEQPEFQPILRDVRELVERMVAEQEVDRERNPWTTQRLKQTLKRHLEGEKVVMLANREPYIHERTAAWPCSTRRAAWSPPSNR